ncbi:cofactor assembly of complex C subunit B [Aliterella atlantica]|uniref:Cofactor assembly of complex C subunit B n=1 Tax=Aliterella atlantica CENA595 TaxID=1618023 RepID=A0A0D8ZWW1_9CYAN|nr:cofactor assembly of complex C subunit B [Aliterella atlantica]KJH73245.1 hypothetical protein UH38_00055 [Aliterella atlantica CENA595]
MNTTILPSTFVLTLLLAIGLVFFIRASAKDRIEQVKLISDQPEGTLMAQLQQYFAQRSYQVISLDKESNSVTFEGMVRPSVFLAILLTLLASAGSLSLALVLSFLFPDYGQFFLLLVLLAPGAGIYYWKKSNRKEQVFLRVQPSNSDRPLAIAVTAHRDEIAALQKAVPVRSAENSFEV